MKLIDNIINSESTARAEAMAEYRALLTAADAGDADCERARQLLGILGKSLADLQVDAAALREAAQLEAQIGKATPDVVASEQRAYEVAERYREETLRIQAERNARQIELDAAAHGFAQVTDRAEAAKSALGHLHRQHHDLFGLPAPAVRTDPVPRCTLCHPTAAERRAAERKPAGLREHRPAPVVVSAE